MSCNLGMNAIINVGGTPWTAVSDVTVNGSTTEADVTTRANGGWRKKCPALRDLTVDITGFYDAADTVFGVVRDAWLAGELVESVQVLTATDGEGVDGDFMVASFGYSQPLEEGQQFNVTLSLHAYNSWVS